MVVHPSQSLISHKKHKNHKTKDTIFVFFVPFVAIFLEPYDRVRAAFDVDGIDKTNAVGVGGHNDRMRPFA